MLTDADIDKFVLQALAQVGNGHFWNTLTHESGPYDIAVVNRDTTRLFKSFLAAAEPVIRASERERCAKLCEPWNHDRPDDWTEFARAKAECAAAIRQLGAGSKGDDRG